MNFSQLKILILLFIFCFGCCACGNENSPDVNEKTIDNNVASGLEKTTAFERDTVRLDGLRMEKTLKYNPRNKYWYTFNYLNPAGKMEESLPAKLEEPNTKKVISDQNEKNTIDIPKSVFLVSETDRPPLFDIICLTEKDPEECSNEKINDFIKSNINFPNNAITSGHDGLELVTFVIDETGTIEDRIKVLSKETPCKNCAKAAVDVVSKMEKWTPAMREGKPVKTRVTLPIRFETKDG